jgi:hypothetical protein
VFPALPFLVTQYLSAYLGDLLVHGHKTALSPISWGEWFRVMILCGFHENEPDSQRDLRWTPPPDTHTHTRTHTHARTHTHTHTHARTHTHTHIIHCLVYFEISVVPR